jgi:hypothetical protein
VILDSVTAYNTLQMNDTIRFYSQLWGDLNYDYDLTVQDILIFNKKWPLVDLGPFENEPPFVRPRPDGNSDLTDLSAFAKMWQWRYFNLSFDTTRSLTRSESLINITGKGSRLLITTPKLSSMGELLIGDTDIDLKKSYVSNFGNEGFIFKAYDPLNEIVQFSFANDSGIDSTIAIYLPKNASGQFSGTIQYHFFDSYGKALSEGVSHLNVKFLPEKFQVYKNYPNPFNPVTFIEYDLPDTRNVGITVVDILGRTVKSNIFRNLKPGRHTYKWNGIGDLGHNASAGVYFLYIQAGQDVSIQKMLLLK